jgi:hypothetical protein
MAPTGVLIGTILAVHLQKCSHLSNELRVMQKKNCLPALIHGLKIGIDLWYCYPIKGGIWMMLNLLMESLFII